MKNEIVAGHIIALFTIFVWGVTFVSTKVLLASFQPVEILWFRFLMGFLALYLVSPGVLQVKDRKHHGLFAAAGFTGICLYYLLENMALEYTMASNVAVILASAPLFTVIVLRLFRQEGERLRPVFYLGFVVAMAGICLISFHGVRLKLNPAGDVLALAAGVVWAFYALCTKEIGKLGYHPIKATRVTFGYGLLFMLPVLLFSDLSWDWSRFLTPVNIMNLLFLGLVASAMCFVTWMVTVRLLGAVRTSLYIYLIPVITVGLSAVVLHEPVTLISSLGIVLTLGGLFLSQRA